MNVSGHLPWVPEVLFFLANGDATAVRNASSLPITSYIGANLEQPEIGKTLILNENIFLWYCLLLPPGSCQNGQVLGSSCILFSVLLQHYNVGGQNSLLYQIFIYSAKC